MNLSCVNGFVKDPACCDFERGMNHVHGIKITDEARTYYYNFPIGIRIHGSKLIFKTTKGIETHYRLDQFTQTTAQIIDIITRCAAGVFGNQLILKRVIYTVDAGNQSLFLAPKAADENYLSSDYYFVFLNGVQLANGEDDGQWQLNGGDVQTNDVIEDITPNGVNTVEIFYFVTK